MLKLLHRASGKQYDFLDGLDVFTIGRADSNHVSVDDPHVSALHGQIVCRGGDYSYYDLKSTNGSAVERAGQRMPVDPLSSLGMPLQQGDWLLLGSEKDPVALEVVHVDHKAVSSLPPQATVIAKQRMSPASEVTARLEASGRGLAPILSFAAQLAEASAAQEVFEIFSAVARVVAPQNTMLALVDAQNAPVRVLWDTAAADESKVFLNHPPMAQDEWQVVEVGSQQQLIWIPADREHALWLGVRAHFQSCSQVEMDALSLCAMLMGGRLRQLLLMSQVEVARSQLAAKNRYLKDKVDNPRGHLLVGRGAAMTALRKQIQTVALSDVPVLITGPSGSGKELVAREIHRQSLRHHEIFAAVNCGALVENLLETELFGCKKGAFTGAYKDREGLFEVSHNGTLFLDEIGEMSPSLQVKLLRVLETGEVMPVGANRFRRVNVRLLTATHRNLAEEVKTGRFREDLFYRIHVFPIQVPPLSQRQEDIPELVGHFIKIISDSAKIPSCSISEDAVRLLQQRDFPGNVRQLANEIQRAMLLAGANGTIECQHFGTGEKAQVPVIPTLSAQGSLKQQLAKVERSLIEQALAKNQGNRTVTARELGITRQALLIKLNRLGVEA